MKMSSDWRSVIRGLIFYGSFISLFKVFYYLFKLDREMDSDPTAGFHHESIFTRFNTANNKLRFGQHLTIQQERTIEYLLNNGLREDEIFGLLLGRYIKTNGKILLNIKLEIFLTLLLLVLIIAVFSLLAGLAYDLAFQTQGAGLVKFALWLIIASILVVPSLYLADFVTRPTCTFYKHRSIIQKLNDAHKLDQCDVRFLPKTRR
jgi:hypothetical protein